MNYLSIEKASFHAWPAFEQCNNDGWVLRFADGYTKRANSITVLTGNSNPLENQIINCEKKYNTQSLPCIFRLLSYNNNSEIERILDSRGYTKGDHSFVMVQGINNKKFKPSDLEEIKADEWMRHYCQLSNKNINDHSTHIKMIKSIKDKNIPVLLRREGRPVSCGLGVIHNGFFGIFDIVTRPHYRNAGYGAELINGMLSWAVQGNAHTAYVQVLSNNEPAVGLYTKLGYEPAYEYHYKVQKHSQANSLRSAIL